MKENKFTIGRNRVKVTSFDSLQDLTNYLDNSKTTETFKYDTSSTLEGRESWCGTKNWNEARELLRNGWSEKAKELESKLSQKLNNESSQVMRQKSVYDVVGGNCSVPRYLQGVPNSMVRQVRTPVKQKTITVNYNITFNSRTTAKEITDKAVECLAYVKRLEDSGTRVNLNVFFVSEDTYFGRDTFAYVVPVKKTGERFSISKVAFALCHPSMLRRIFFATMERDQDVPSEFVGNYGRAVRDKTALEKIFPNTEFFS